MKKVIILLILAFLGINSQAQDERGYFGISLGPSIPLGDLASTDIDNDAAGWATTGAVLTSHSRISWGTEILALQQSFGVKPIQQTPKHWLMSLQMNFRMFYGPLKAMDGE